MVQVSVMEVVMFVGVKVVMADAEIFLFREGAHNDLVITGIS